MKHELDYDKSILPDEPEPRRNVRYKAGNFDQFFSQKQQFASNERK
jgi:hypothetical protein